MFFGPFRRFLRNSSTWRQIFRNLFGALCRPLPNDPVQALLVAFLGHMGALRNAPMIGIPGRFPPVPVLGSEVLPGSVGTCLPLAGQHGGKTKKSVCAFPVRLSPSGRLHLFRLISSEDAGSRHASFRTPDIWGCLQSQSGTCHSRSHIYLPTTEKPIPHSPLCPTSWGS